MGRTLPEGYGDEANASQGMISRISPLARALPNAREGDMLCFDSPWG